MNRAWTFPNSVQPTVSNLSAHAACAWSRLKGRKGYPASCTTPVEAGMKIRTQTERAVEDSTQCDGAVYLRPSARLPDLFGQWRLRIAGHGGCRRPARCALWPRRQEPSRCPVDTSNPYFQFDASKCIVCSRCVRACDEVQGTFALTIQGRGFDSKVSSGIDEDFLDSECVSCGACVQACPTAT